MAVRAPACQSPIPLNCTLGGGGGRSEPNARQCCRERPASASACVACCAVLPSPSQNPPAQGIQGAHFPTLDTSSACAGAQSQARPGARKGGHAAATSPHRPATQPPNGKAPAPPAGGLSLDTLNPKLLEAEYAVRGAIAIKSQDYQRRIKEGDTSLPFSKVYQCNIGAPPVATPRAAGRCPGLWVVWGLRAH